MNRVSEIIEYRKQPISTIKTLVEQSLIQLNDESMEPLDHTSQVLVMTMANFVFPFPTLIIQHGYDGSMKLLNRQPLVRFLIQQNTRMVQTLEMRMAIIKPSATEQEIKLIHDVYDNQSNDEPESNTMY